jgi:hypothetical protein
MPFEDESFLLSIEIIDNVLAVEDILMLKKYFVSHGGVRVQTRPRMMD